MSAEQVKIVLGRAVREPEFRGLLFRDPGQAIAGYELTEAELSSLKGLTPENFDSMAAMLEERISKSALGPISSSEMTNKTSLDRQPTGF